MTARMGKRGGRAAGTARKPQHEVGKLASTRARGRARDNFTLAVLRVVAQEVGYRCSNPHCRAPTTGPSRAKGVSNVGVGAHITAAAPGGPRFDGTLTADERRSAANAIWLCNTCGRLVDNDVSTYTVAALVQWKVDAVDYARAALASGGRSTTEGLFAAHLELQKRGLAQQQAAQDAQTRQQQMARFQDSYALFLEHATSYSRARDDYQVWMYRTQYKPDRLERETRQQPVRDAQHAMERALQSILLMDPDETRRKLRWEVIRGRRLDPIIDTTENQRDFAAVIHYQNLRLDAGIARLQANVREALGHPRLESGHDDFIETTLAEAKQNADAAEARIKARHDSYVREHGATG